MGMMGPLGGTVQPGVVPVLFFFLGGGRAGLMHMRPAGGAGSGQPVAADGKSLVTFNASLAVSKLGVNSQQASNVPAQLRPGAREWNAAQHAS